MSPRQAFARPVEDQRVVVAMSGGVDSSVAAAILVDQGYDVTGVMLRLWSEPGDGRENRCCTAQALQEARRVADGLGIPFHVVDCSRQFKAAVVDSFIEEYARGRTPNPCIACNRQIKFGYLLKTAHAAGPSYLATGHYARVQPINGTYRLTCAADSHKDQSYFLYTLGQEQLRSALFPLGELTKAQVRAIADQTNMPVAQTAESQDICFVRDQNHTRFLRSQAPHIFEPGPILDREGRELGRHQGLPLYTIGQRRGIGITWSEPLYVLEKDVARNALVVGPAAQLGRDTFRVENPSFVVGHPPYYPAHVKVKIRSTAPAADATLYESDDCELTVRTARPLRDVTAGQAAVFYRGEEVLGGGTIASSDRRRGEWHP